ncbi:MAG: SpoIIIAH-like family protein [Clostridiales bacterium]|nr:SpoIIIAH-like family protein [Clostridiales bacterium]
MSKKKRFFIISAFCLLLLATGTINVLVNNSIIETQQTGQTNNTVTAGNFFTNYRANRTDTRNEELMYLEAIIASTTSSQEAIASAEAEKIRIVSAMESEMALEGLIKAKGFEDVIISDLNNSLTVIVKSAELDKAEVAKIVEVVQGQTSYDIENIKIIPVE